MTTNEPQEPCENCNEPLETCEMGEHTVCINCKWVIA